MSNSYLSKSTLWRFAVLTVIFLFFLFVYRVGFALYNNNQLRKEFSSSTTSSPYQQRVQMEKMDMSAFNPYFPKIFTALDYDLKHRIETPISLKYYSKIPIDGKGISFEIPKDTTIVAIPEWTTGSKFYEIGYGYTSYPTYEKGWRYVRPFILADDLNPVDNEQFYYVDMGSLEAVLDKVIEVNQPFQAEIRQQGWSLKKGQHVVARYIDNALYQHGVYLSPDLFYKVIDRWNAILLGAIGIIVATYLLGRGTWSSRK